MKHVRSFDDILGSGKLTAYIKESAVKGRIPHAVMLVGEEGSGKKTFARLFSKTIQCEKRAAEPCMECQSCRQVDAGQHPDIVMIGPDEGKKSRSISVKTIRATIADGAFIKPYKGPFKIYIVDRAESMTAEAQNALLKILEEPPEHLMFILATTELQKVPATILSRCQRHSFKRIDAPAIADYLLQIAQKEGFTLHEDAAQLIARLADGGVRDALSLLDQCSARETIDRDAVYSAMGLAGNRRTLALMDGILGKRTDRVLKDFNALWMDGKDPAVLLTELNGLLRDTLMMKVAPKGGLSLISGAYDSESLQSLAARLTQEELLCMMETMQNALASMRQSTNPRTAAELCLVSLCDNTLGESVSGLRARISRLEEQLRSGRVVTAPAPAAQEAGEERPPFPEEEYPEPGALEPEDEPEQAAEEPAAPAPQEAEPAAPAEENSAETGWAEICARVAPQLSKDIGTRLNDPGSLRGRLEGNQLRIEAAPGFLFMRVNRQEVLSKFSAAASELCGREIRAVASELKQEAGAPQTRSLEELRGFKEVKFI